MNPGMLKHVRELAMTLSPEEQFELVADLVAKLRGVYDPPPKKPHPSLWGALKDLGPAPSAEEIDEARRQEWAHFPSEDITR